MRRVLLYDDVFKTIVRLQAGRLKAKDADDVDGIKKSIRDALADLKQDKDAKFAIVAFADEAARTSADPLISKGWEVQSAPNKQAKLSLAESEPFFHANAGSTFYSELDRISKEDKPETGEVLEVYCLCLLLGFRGSKKEADRQVIIKRTIIQVEQRLGKPQDFLVSSAYLREDLAESRSSRRALPVIVMVALGCSALYALLQADILIRASDLRLPVQVENR